MLRSWGWSWTCPSRHDSGSAHFGLIWTLGFSSATHLTEWVIEARFSLVAVGIHLSNLMGRKTFSEFMVFPWWLQRHLHYGTSPGENFRPIENLIKWHKARSGGKIGAWRISNNHREESGNPRKIPFFFLLLNLLSYQDPSISGRTRISANLYLYIIFVRTEFSIVVQPQDIYQENWDSLLPHIREVLFNCERERGGRISPLLNAAGRSFIWSKMWKPLYDYKCHAAQIFNT